MSGAIRIHREGLIATLTLSNPGKLNALTKPMWMRVGEMMRELSADDAVRCIVLRGEGDQAFSAGADISGASAAGWNSPRNATCESAASPRASACRSRTSVW